MNKPSISSRTKSALASGAALVSSFLMLPDASAELIAYEGFEYAINGVLGTDLVGSGSADEYWTGPWQDVNRRISPPSSAPVLEGSLSYVDSNGATLATAGNSVHVIGGAEGEQQNWIGRLFKSPPSNEPGSVVYISVIAQRVGEEADPSAYPNDTHANAYPFGDNLFPSAATIALLQHQGPEYNWDVRFGNPARTAEEPDTWKMQGKDVGKGPFEAPGPDISFSEAPAFAVLRIEFTAETLQTTEGVENVTGTHLTFYVNPLLESEEANEGIAQAMTDENEPFQAFLEGISLMIAEAADGWNQNGDTGFRPAAELLVDEIRVGTTWADVTPAGESGGGDEPMIAALAFFELESDAGADFWIETDGLGWVYAEGYPWIYSYSEQSWLFSYETGATFAAGSWFWDARRGTWVYFDGNTYPWVWVHDQGWVDGSSVSEG